MNSFYLLLVVLIIFLRSCVKRSYNNVAHGLAHFTTVEEDESMWDFDFPDSVNVGAQTDLLKYAPHWCVLLKKKS